MRQPSRMIRYRHARIWIVTLALSGCSMPGPYQTYSPGTPAAPPPPTNALVVYGTKTTPAASPSVATPAGSQRVAICYSRLWSSADAVHSSAVQACGGKGARIVGQDTDLDACPALAPTHAIFACGQ